MDQPWLFVAFTVFVLGMLAVDLGVFHRQAPRVSLREAGAWSAVWIALALASTPGCSTSAGRRRGWSSSPAT